MGNCIPLLPPRQGLFLAKHWASPLGEEHLGQHVLCWHHYHMLALLQHLSEAVPNLWCSLFQYIIFLFKCSWICAVKVWARGNTGRQALLKMSSENPGGLWQRGVLSVCSVKALGRGAPACSQTALVVTGLGPNGSLTSLPISAILWLRDQVLQLYKEFQSLKNDSQP